MTMGRLVNQPLRDFSDLTGQNGCLIGMHKRNSIKLVQSGWQSFLNVLKVVARVSPMLGLS